MSIKSVLPIILTLNLLVYARSSMLAQTITGTVYYDLNQNAAKDAPEIGVPSITVTAYNTAGVSAATATTSATGTYTLSSLTNGQNYRVEFTNLPTGYFNSIFGTGSGTTVQFVTASATGVDLGICHPSDYCQANPNIAIPCYDAGASTQSGFTDVNTHPGIVSFPSTASATTGGMSTTPAPTKNVAFGKVGATWGGAWKKNTKRMFYSAVLKRHVDLGEFARPLSNSQTVDGVYMIDYNGLAGTYIGGFRLQGVNGIDLGSVSRSIKTTAVSGTTAADDNALSSVNRQSRDLAAFSKVGKVGFGDIVMSEDYKYLWLVNLNQKSLIRVDVSNQALLPTTGGTPAASLVSTYNINFSAITSCNGQLRPWALSFYHGRGYLGVVCDGSTGAAADLKAYVLSFDPANVAAGFTKEFEMALNYTRENSAWPTASNSAYRLGTWRPWTDTWSLPALGGEFSWAEPILSNIEFTPNGSMVLGFLDRGGVQFDYQQFSPISGNSKLIDIDAAGDIVYVCKTASGFKVEGDATGCVIDSDPGGTPSVSLANDGPKNVGEFFYQDMASSNPAQHMEVTLGGLAMLQGTQQVFTNAFDPIVENFNQGGHFYSTVTGKRTAQYQITPNGVNKGVGLGEPEVMCNVPPIQIGNFVWKDTDNDGVQDAGETPLQGVTVKLYAADGTTVIATATTDAKGQYYFSNATGTSTANNIYGLALTPSTNYFLKVTSLGTHSSVTGLSLTTPTTGGTSGINAGTSLANNDAVVSSGIPTIALTTGFYGEHNDTYDFGFTACSVTATASASPSTVCAGQSVTLSVSGGNSGSTYTWSGPNGFTSTTQSPTISGVSDVNSGTYSVTVSNSPTCTATSTVSVVVTTVTATAANSAGCVGGAILLSATGGGTYAWAGPNGFTSTLQNPTLTTSTASDAGTYAVQVTKNGCTVSANTVVTLSNATASATSNSPLCAGSVLQLSASGSGTSYLWSGPSGFTSTLQNPSVSPVVAGTYNVTVTGGSCAGTASTTVVVNPTPVATVTKGTVCVSESIQLHATGGTTYAWSGPNGFSSTSSDPVISPAALANAGTYSVTITGASTLCSASVPVNVTLGSIFLYNYAEIINADQVVSGVTLANNSTTETDDAFFTTELIPCTQPSFSLSATRATCNGAVANSNAQLNVTSITNGTRIGWSVGATYTGPAYAGATNLSGATYTIGNLENPSDSLRYTVRVFNGGDCCVEDISVVLYPAPCAAATSNSPICLNGTINLQASGGLTYAWSGPNGFTSPLQNPSIASATAAAAGTYTVTVTSYGNTSTATTTVAFNTPTASAGANSPVAVGQAINLTASGGATYAWSGPNSFTSTEQNPTISSATLAYGGTYTVTVTNAEGCTATATVSVSVTNNACSQTVTAAANTVCEGQTLNLTATPSVSGASYNWTGPNGFTSNLQNPSITNATDDHHTGAYIVSVTTAAGCTGSSSVNVTVGKYPTAPIITGTTVVSVGDALTLTAESDVAATYTWTKPNATTATGSVLTIPSVTTADAGTYSVAVSLGSCTLNASTSVTVNPTTHLTLTKTADKSTVTPGANETVVFTLTLNNSGTIAAPNTKVRDLLPSGMTYVSSSTANGTYNPTTGIWDVGTVPVGNVTLTITATLQ
ncbi:MAG: DUF11 domain-containing protein [Saprospiraceae bacterium]|nr:DUF11 domain-containing protein [Saprospiraceae bacterium]